MSPALNRSSAVRKISDEIIFDLYTTVTIPYVFLQSDKTLWLLFLFLLLTLVQVLFEGSISFHRKPTSTIWLGKARMSDTATTVNPLPPMMLCLHRVTLAECYLLA